MTSPASPMSSGSPRHAPQRRRHPGPSAGILPRILHKGPAHLGAPPGPGASRGGARPALFLGTVRPRDPEGPGRGRPQWGNGIRQLVMTAQDALPMVSIITPSFNQGRFIRDTIESVLSQDYPRLEHIVMDGGSDDDTLDILRSYGSRIVWRSAPDQGQADAVNLGFRLAKGEILGWLNS